MKRIIYVIIILLCLFYTMGFTGGSIDKNCPTGTPAVITDIPSTNTSVPDTETPVPTPTKEFTRTPQPTDTQEVPTRTDIPTSSPIPTTAISTAVVTSTLPTVTADSPTATRRIKKTESTATPRCNEKEAVAGCLPTTGFNYLWFVPLGFILIAVIFIARKLRKSVE